MTTGSVLAQFTITLSQAVSEQVAVEWHTADGTAHAGVDYAASKGTALFAPGETSKTVEILVYGRAVGSEDRSFFVEMLPPTNAILGASVGECIIHVDTTGSIPVTVIVVPAGPRGLQGKSAYQVWLDLGNTGTEQDFIDSLSPSAQEIAEEVAPLLNVGDTVLTAEGTNGLNKPDATTVKAVARRVAYVRPTKIATVVLANGDNIIAQSDLTGDIVDIGSVGLYPRIMRGSDVLSPQWSVEADGRLLINGAISGDVLYICQYDIASSLAVTRLSFQALRRSYAEAGYNLIGKFSNAGLTLEDVTDVVLWEPTGHAYSWSGTLPHDISEVDSPAGDPLWVIKDTVSLRSTSQLRVSNISELMAFGDHASAIYMHEFHAGTGIGGGLFKWDAGASKTLHDGGRFLDPSKPLPNWSSELSVAAWLDPGALGVGLWVRQHPEREIDAAWFGVLPQSGAGQISSKKQMERFYSIITSAPTGLDTRLSAKHPCGTYYITGTITVGQAFFIDYQFDSFELKLTDDSAPTGDAVIIYNSPVQCSWDGSHIINANNKTKYAIAYDRATGAGTSGGFSSGLVTMNAQWQMRISAADTSTLFSEFVFSNYRSFGCKNAIHAGGYNTVITFSGVSLVSVLDPDDPSGADSCTLLVEGATVNVSGGELVRPGTTTGNLINIRPASNGKYGNVRVSGAHIETSAPLANVSNPAGYALDSSIGGLSVTGCGGYTGGSTTASFITTEPNFDGVVVVKGCDFYRDTLSVARIIDAQGPCRHDIDSSTWDGFSNIKWGGINTSDTQPSLQVSGLPAAVIPAGDVVLKFQNESSIASMQFMASLYNPATGEFTIPPHGPHSINVSGSLYAPGVSGNLSIKVGGALMAIFDISPSSLCHFSKDIYGLNSGDKLTISVQSPTPSSGSSFSSLLNDLNVRLIKTTA